MNRALVKQRQQCFCPLMKFLLQRTLVQSLPPENRENRTRLGMLAGWVSVAISIFMAAVKCLLGHLSGSVSMMADAINNLSDVGSSLVIAIGFQWSRKPRDEKHPFGYGRIETVTTVVLAIALLVVGIEVGQSGILRLLNPQPIEAPAWLLLTVGVTLAIKAWMALFARQLAKLSKSQALEADAWNHTFDVVCSLMVILALASSHLGWGALDGWTAVGVAAFIIYTGICYGRDALTILLGKKPDLETIREIYSTVLGVEGVVNVHEIMVHHYGDVQMVSLHIEVDAGLSLMEAHNISEMAKLAVEKTFHWRALAHLDPVDRSHPFWERLSQVVHDFVNSDVRLIGVHDLRAEGEMAPYRVSFDLVTDMETGREQYSAVYFDCLAFLQQAFGKQVSRAEVGLEAIVESAPMERRHFDLAKGCEKNQERKIDLPPSGRGAQKDNSANQKPIGIHNKWGLC